MNYDSCKTVRYTVFTHIFNSGGVLSRFFNCYSLLSVCYRSKRTREHDDFGSGSVLKMLGSAEHRVAIEDSFIVRFYIKLCHLEICVCMCMEYVHEEDSTGRSSSYGAKL